MVEIYMMTQQAFCRLYFPFSWFAFFFFFKYQMKLDASFKFSKYLWLKSQLQDVAKNNRIMKQVLWH